MPIGKGKRVALIGITVAVALSATVVVLRREFLVESWHIYRLRSGDQAVRLRAADELADRKCLRATARLVELIEAEEGEAAWDHANNRRVRRQLTLTPLAHALYRLGSGAASELEELKALYERQSARVVGIVDQVLSAWKDSSLEVKRVEYGHSPQIWTTTIPVF